MRKFSLILPNEVVEHRRFIWSTRSDDCLRLFVRLVGCKVNKNEITAVYQPTFSFEKSPGKWYLEIHFSRWTSYIIKFSLIGINGKWYDMRNFK